MIRRLLRKRAERRSPAPSIAPNLSLDDFFDRGLTPDHADRLLKAVHRDRSLRSRFDQTQDILDELRRPVDCPDFTHSVLAQVGLRRGFLPRSARRAVLAGRYAAAACLLLALTGMLVARRNAPEAFPSVATGPAPLTEVVSSGRAEAIGSVASFSSSIQSIVQSATAPAAPRAVACSFTATGGSGAGVSPALETWVLPSGDRLVAIRAVVFKDGTMTCESPCMTRVLIAPSCRPSSMTSACVERGMAPAQTLARIAAGGK